MQALLRNLARHPPRRRLPAQQMPKAIEREYALALLAILARVRSAFEPLRAELPALLAAAQREREDALREDAGEGRRIRQLIEEAKQRIGAAISSAELADLAERFAERVSAFNRVQLARQVRAAIGVDVFATDRRVPALVEGFVAENVELITNIPEKVAAEIAQATTRAVASGTLHGDLARDIEERLGLGANRAKLIARDQVGKLYGQINIARQRELGGDGYVWRTSKDRRVRGTPGGAYPNAVPSHFAREGQFFRYSSPPPGGHPGEAILCRCHAEPDFSKLLDDL